MDLKHFFLISSSLILNALKLINNHLDVNEIEIGIQKTLSYTISLLEEKAEAIKSPEILNKTIQHFIPEENNMAPMISQVFEKIGKSGKITTTLSNDSLTSVEIEYGLQINRGYSSPYFLTNLCQQTIELENPYIYITKKKISLKDKKFIQILELTIHAKRPLLVISSDIDEEALSTLILNKMNGIIEVAYIKIPISFGIDSNLFDDIAFYTESNFFDNSRAHDLIKLVNLGQAKKVKITKAKTIIWAKNHNILLQKKSENIKKQLLLTNSSYEIEKLKDRSKNFNKANAVLRIGSLSEIEGNELRSRIDKGLLQLKGCLYEGVLPNGLLDFILISEDIENWTRSNLFGSTLIGSILVCNAFFTPLEVLLRYQNLNNLNENTSFLPFFDKEPIILKKSISKSFSKNRFLNLLKSNYLDSFKTIKIELQSICSITYSLLSIGQIVF